MQFSGFSDVAIGLSLLLGFRVVENFNYPFLATSIGEFWKCWHMSLSLWCRDYVYFPALALTRNVSIAILFSMVILGGWHEISLRYIGWGLLHACVLNFMHVWKKTAIADLLHSRLPGYKLFAWLLTIHFVVFSFVLVSEDNIADSMKLYRILFWIS